MTGWPTPLADLLEARRQVFEQPTVEAAERWSAAARMLVGLHECRLCGSEDCFTQGKFLGIYYVTTCQLCRYAHILDTPAYLQETGA